MRPLPILAAAAAALVLGLGSPAWAQTSGDLRLYTLDCGTLALDDMAPFSDTGEHAGEAGVMAVPCFLVHDREQWLLWDTGLGDRLAAIPGGMRQLGGQWTVRRTLADQLADLGLKPGDITYVALSHIHADHSGNANLFPEATWLMDPVELTGLKTDPAPLGVQPERLTVLDHAMIRAVNGDADVFGDGRVIILKTPGHTPGHKSLLVRLERAGPILLTGDLFHTRENRAYRRVPAVNVDRADTLASFDRFEGVAAHEAARVIIQHSLEDVASLPKAPAWLD
ncbi:MBL fold metallo-hydrolase [Brevundimonas intermedia]|uniref:MBL fold metallo-hydrolase n=1 Tax=Brevundimonas intermedia TaxID=74315 RepID=A0ABQ5T4J0_9CAUL|nr:N-acyl homoserine lactonase family protein [Brevundimonas intermedia]GLK47677.1 MBL fold metallo-hydrolase [Brevundimonas intermedia]